MPSEPGPFIVNPLKAQDIPFLVSIDAVSNFPSWTEKMFAKELELAFSIGAVASWNDMPVAFGVAWLVDGTAQLHQMAVAPQHRRKGLGKKILYYIMERAREGGGSKIELELRQDNGPARRLYEKTGFKVVGARKGFYDPIPAAPQKRVDAILMTCDI